VRGRRVATRAWVCRRASPSSWRTSCEGSMVGRKWFCSCTCDHDRLARPCRTSPRTGASQPWRTQSRSWLRKGSRLAEIKGPPSVAQPCSVRRLDSRPPAPCAFSKTSTSQPAAASVPAQLAPAMPAPTMPARCLAIRLLFLLCRVFMRPRGGMPAAATRHGRKKCSPCRGCRAANATGKFVFAGAIWPRIRLMTLS